MKNERILNALSRADDKYVEEAMLTAAPSKSEKNGVFEAEAVKAESVTVTAPKRKIYAGSIAAAACACVAAGGLIFWSAMGGLDGLSEGPASGSADEFAQTMSPEENGYHNFTLTLEQLHNCAWSCFIPDYFPEGYHFSGEAQCGQANGVANTDIDMQISFWLSNGIDDPDAKGYNPVYFSVTVGDNSIVEGEHIYELETLTVNDITEMGKGGLIDCGHNVRLQISYPYPELVSAEEIHDMIMSMPYAKQWMVSGYHIEYLTGDEVYSTPFADCLPTALPAGYGITGLSPYTYTKYDSISLYISNGVEDPELSSYCPIRYIVQPNTEVDTDMPVYQDILKLTLQDIEAAMEKGGFHVVSMGADMIEVTFPRADRISAEEIYSMVMSAPCAADPNGESRYTTVYLSQEELYNCEWRMFLPRKLPENYSLTETTQFNIRSSLGEGTLYLEFTDGNNRISYTVYADTSTYDSLDTGSALIIRDISVGDMPLLKENGWIDCDNAAVKIKVDIENTDLISDLELYQMIMSVPFAGNFADSGIKTGKLPDYIETYLPAVDFDEYYDTEKITVRTHLNERDFTAQIDMDFADGVTMNGGFDGEMGTIVAYDGKRVYFVNSGVTNHSYEHQDGVTRNDNVEILGAYDLEYDNYHVLERCYNGILNFVTIDGEYLYYTVAETDEKGNILHTSLHRRITEELFQFFIPDQTQSAPLFTVDGALSDLTISGRTMYFTVWLDSMGEQCSGIVGFNMDADVEAAIEANELYLTMLPFEESVHDMSMEPYKGGVLFSTDTPGSFMKYYYWDGQQDSAVYMLEAGEYYIHSDGEIIYCYEADSSNLSRFCTYNDYRSQSGAVVFDSIANSTRNYGGDNDHTAGDGICTSGAEGLILLGMYGDDLFYDARNGWFTVFGDGGAYATRSNIAGGEDKLLIVDDLGHDVGAAYKYDQDYVTLYVITRK